jgi:hypothetical protein
MVHTTSAVAVAVLALGAASALAAPSYEYTDDIAQREFDLEVRDFDELDAREYFDLDEFDARSDFSDYDVDARDFDFDFEEARELLDNYDVDSREFDFGEYEEREVMELPQEIVERAPTSTSATSSVPSTTITTITSKPTGGFFSKKKETKTVVSVVRTTPKKCKKVSAFAKFFGKQNNKLKKHSQIRHENRKKKAAAKKAAAKLKAAKAAGITLAPTSTKATSTSTSVKSTSTKTTSTSTADWLQITPPPSRKIPKGMKYSQKKVIGKDKITTISRTVTAAATACPTDTKKKSKRDLEDISDVFERSYHFDELD